MTEKFKNNLKCICNNIVVFEIINDVECNWGIHTLIQCPKCEELLQLIKNVLHFKIWNYYLKTIMDCSQKKNNQIIWKILIPCRFFGHR